MKRLLALIVGCLLLGLVGVPGVFGQKKKESSLDIPDRKEVPQMLLDLKSGDAAVRARAANRIGALGQVNSGYVRGAVPRLLQMAKSDADTAARKAAAHSLGLVSADPKEAVPILIDLLKDDKEISVKIAAAESLGYFLSEGKDAVGALRDAQAMAKGAAKDEKDKIALGKAAGVALKMITGAKK